MAKAKKVTYTGRTIEVCVNQTDFIQGRMNYVPSKRYKNRAKTDPCTELEAADFKSGVGDLHWVTSQTRVDHAVDTSRFQKRQTKLNYGDYLDLARVVKEVKQTADFSLRITQS